MRKEEGEKNLGNIQAMWLIISSIESYGTQIKSYSMLITLCEKDLFGCWNNLVFLPKGAGGRNAATFTCQPFQNEQALTECDAFLTARSSF